MVRFDRVGLRYGTAGGQAGPEVLHDLSFTLPNGAFRWLLGPAPARPACCG
jgi:ABC-type ATPase involved in cell division